VNHRLVHINLEWFDALLRLAFLSYMLISACQFLAPVEGDFEHNYLHEMTDNSGEQDSDEVDPQLDDDLAELYLVLYVHKEGQLNLNSVVPFFTSEYRDVLILPPEI
jgi:hypothetical protein